MKFQLPVILYFFTFLSSAASAQVISTEENYAINRPGIVKVEIEFSANVYVNKVVMNESVFRKLVDSVKALDTTKSILKASDKLNIVLSALNKNPLRYFNSTDDYFRQRHRVAADGSGFFITGDGYVVTNCHVIDKDSVFIRRQFLLSTFREVTDENINSLQSSWGMLLNDDQRDLLSNTFAGLYTGLSSLILVDLNKEIFVIYKTGMPGESGIKKIPAQLIRKGASVPGKDVAILKIDGDGKLPTLTLSKDSLPFVGTQVLAFGYPEPVTNNLFLAPETINEPTLTSGIVSAVKKTIDGWPVIQVDAMVSHGNSGGPVCNEKGEVIGIISFGSIENTTGGLAGGFNFAIPVSIVKEFIDSASVKATTSITTMVFNRALHHFYSGYYKRALNGFEEAASMNKEYPQLNFYIRQSKLKIEAGADRETMLWKYILVGSVFFFLVFLFWYMSRRSKK